MAKTDLAQARKYAEQCKHWVAEADRHSSPFLLQLAIRKLSIARRHADGADVPELEDARQAGKAVALRLQAEIEAQTPGGDRGQD